MQREITRDQLWIAADQKKKEREYWLEKLSGEWRKSRIPYDKKGRGEAPEREALSLRFSGETQAGLLKLANGSDLRLYLVLLAGVFLLLKKYTRHTDLIVGTPILRQEQSEGLINTILPLRTEIGETTTFKELLPRLGQTFQEAVENQSYPMEILAEQLGRAKPEEESPLFDTALLLENLQEEHYLESARPSLLFSLVRREDSVEGALTWNPACFERATVQQLADHYRFLIEQALHNLDEPVAALQVLSDAERRKIAYQFNPSDVPYPKEKTLPELFEAQAAGKPGADAVVCGDVRYTYGELNAKADRLASVLRAKGVGRDQVVGLMVERSAEIIVGIWGILKAGGAYLPMDSKHPEERISYMLKDSEALLCLTDSATEARIQGDWETLRLDAKLPNASIQENPPFHSSAKDLAYVLYTSGTTGKPKGVMVEHRNVHNLVHGLYERVYKRYGEGLNVSMLSTHVFDASVQQMFPALLLGHTLHIVPDEVKVDGRRLLSFYKENEIHISDGTPSHLRLLLETLGEKKVETGSLKHFLVGGEALPQQVAEKFRQRFEPVEPTITNAYGPTECCVQSTSYDIDPEMGEKYQTVPIGRPMPNESIYILGEHGELLPIGVPGELCISGDGVSRGYLKRPELTAEKFVDNPFLPGERLYCTGDIARWSADGQIEYMGRLDQQVQISGHRIELEEIENTLRNFRYPMTEEGSIGAGTDEMDDRPDSSPFRDVVVVDRADEQGDNYLCAYIVADGGIDTNEIRGFLGWHLPDYMIPAYFVQLDNIPLTVSGKLDRQALPDPKKSVHAGSGYVAPRNEVEQTLVGLWSEVLGLSPDQIGIHDHFFDLGGSSFKVVQFANKMKEEMGREVPVVHLFRYTTISSIAKYLQGDGDAEKELDQVDERTEDALNSLEETMQLLGGSDHDR
ncbi:non-ribosomal peptide synthetase [Paludifilum halophilum]|uniref:Carrier domain-containing protein n=1 Tax=Paludifilum halophilum TaxID=1642702 RepID=A0A235B9W4_9BACL|nr:non-ribosomal peptide synthetase [Paludifilum halophilum]OYD09084.1 hypothetical protein CHM34_04785 [Paludifilum halophilum]